jgi:hypothetical protein
MSISCDDPFAEIGCHRLGMLPVSYQVFLRNHFEIFIILSLPLHPVFPHSKDAKWAATGMGWSRRCKEKQVTRRNPKMLKLLQHKAGLYAAVGALALVAAFAIFTMSAKPASAHALVHRSAVVRVVSTHVTVQHVQHVAVAHRSVGHWNRGYGYGGDCYYSGCGYGYGGDCCYGGCGYGYGGDCCYSGCGYGYGGDCWYSGCGYGYGGGCWYSGCGYGYGGCWYSGCGYGYGY